MSNQNVFTPPAARRLRSATPDRSRLLRYRSLAAALFLTTATAYAQHGIDAADINRQGAACTDFFDYANGAWRASHPIPDYMDRWSRRWESGEINKEHVRDILTELSARSDRKAGTPEQLSGDFYAACMDETQIDALGIKPVQPYLDEVRAIRTRADVERVIGRLHDIGVGVPFGLFGQQDLHDPTQMVANIAAGGLGMPDRDYYLKPEQRFVDARAVPRARSEDVRTGRGESRNREAECRSGVRVRKASGRSLARQRCPA